MASTFSWLRVNLVAVLAAGFGIVSFVIAIYTAFVRIDSVATDSQGRIDKLEKKVIEYQEVGGDGMISPTAHGTLDQQIEHYFNELLGREGFRRLQSQFNTNGGGKSP
jgi:hypothetical protein